ncbi:MAG: hypothetical protein SGI89_04565 [bacterium]|nr:hypothetical protein [bacterium]
MCEYNTANNNTNYKNKSVVTTYARKKYFEFNWQPRFHDHIIRSANEIEKISNYIINNPIKWQEDKFFNSK